MGFTQIWIVSFGAKWISGEGWEPSYLAARELSSRQSIGLDRADLFATPLPPYRTENTALFVCFAGEAMAGCHIRLGWPPPTRLIDLGVEFRSLSNGHRKPCGQGLLGALIWCALPVSGVVPTPISTGDGVGEVAALEQLHLAFLPRLDLPRAILRGRYLVAVARIEAMGIPVDVGKTEALKLHWRNLAGQMSANIFQTKLAIGSDRRHRAPLRPFSSRAGRNQPSSADFLLAAPGWLRRLIMPEAGTGLALIDWAQQEFGIAAALSSDKRMMTDYQSGDPYLALAERCGGLTTRSDIFSSGRNVFKACALGVLNGIGSGSLARQIGCGPAEARLLLQEHRAEYPEFWRWSDRVETGAYLRRRLESVFGWGVAVNADTNPRFLRNFPMQANGAEMLRLACCLATEKGVSVCGVNQDAILIQAPLAGLADAVKNAEAAMAEASKIVLDGFPLRTSVTTIRYPDQYPHPRSDAFWFEIDRALARFEETGEPARKRDASCVRAHPRPISSYVYNRKDQSDADD